MCFEGVGGPTPQGTASRASGTAPVTVGASCERPWGRLCANWAGVRPLTGEADHPIWLAYPSATVQADERSGVETDIH